MSTVTVENIGAVGRVEIPIPEDGGLVVLRGRQGVGKSTCLRAVDALVGGEVALGRRDGAASGEVSGFGATITVKKNARRSGTLEVESLDSRLSIAELVDPHIADPEKADAKRIRALVQMAGTQPDLAAFKCLFATEADFRSVADTIAPGVSDMVQLAALVKRQVEAFARTAESAADKAAGSAAAHRQAAEAGKANFEPGDAAILQGDLEEAIRAEQELKTQAANGQKLQRQAELARKSLDQVQTGYQGLTVDEATERTTAADKRLQAARAALAAAEKELAAAKAEVSEAASLSREAATHATNTKSWQDALKAAEGLKVPAPEEIASASAAVADCHERIKRANLYRQAVAEFKRAKTCEADAALQRARAESLRTVARRTDELLSAAVGQLDCPLRVRDGRLVLNTNRGEELFSDLSQGEKIMVVVPLVAGFLPEDGVLTIPQDFYGEIDPINRVALNDVLRREGVVAITAEATADEELKAEVFDEGN